MKKIVGVQLTLPLDDVKQVYEELIQARDCAVKYDQDQLAMANQTIFQMRGILDSNINYLWNKIHTTI